jgi:tetratricopeptide (TPR) repeat protein
MDLLDFTGEDMYFDQPLPPEVDGLLADAAEHYDADGGTDTAEQSLMRAYFLAPEHLTVLVALYRFYYYRQRYADALTVADRAIALAARELGLDPDWRNLSADTLNRAAADSMVLTRFLLLALKGAGFLLMRMERPADALERLEMAAAIDDSDRLGLGDMLDWARRAAAKNAVTAQGDNIHYIGR